MNNVFDLHHQIAQRMSLLRVNITDTTVFGNIIDTAGFTAVEFIVMTTNVVGDGTFSTVLQHGNDSGLSDVSAVPAADVLGNADFTSADDNIPKRIGYVGGKRYVRLSIVPIGTTGGGGFFSIVILGGPNHQPVSD